MPQIRAIKLVSHTVYYVNLFLGETDIENNIPQLSGNSGIIPLMIKHIWDTTGQNALKYNQKWDAEKVESSVRTENLSFSHHARGDQL